MLPYSIAELYAGLRTTSLEAPIGARWQYSNLGMGLLGHVLERAGGRPYEQLLTDRLLSPLGMNDTKITLSEPDLMRFATHYWYGDAAHTPRERWIFGEFCAMGGIASTVPDLAKYLIFLIRQNRPEFIDGPVVAAATLRAICTAQRIINTRWIDAQALGWMVQRIGEDQQIVVHGGELDGNSAFLAFSIQHGVGVIVLTNTGRDAAGIVGEPLIEEVLAKAAQWRAHSMRLVEQQDWESAVAALEALLARTPADWAAWNALGRARAARGNFVSSADAFEREAALGFSRAAAWYNAACAWAQAGRADDAFRCLAESCRTGFSDRSHAESDADLAELRRDPRWEQLFPRAQPQYSGHSRVL